MKIFQFLLNNWEPISGIAIALYELIVRHAATPRDLSLISNFKKIIDAIAPNKKSDGTLHIIMFVLISSFAYGQSPVITQQRAAMFTNGLDTATFQSTRTSLQTANGNTGGLYFDKTRNKWRIWNGSVWVDLLNTSSGISNVTASNGLTATGTTTKNIALGGALNSGLTTINGNGAFNSVLNFGTGTALSGMSFATIQGINLSASSGNITATTNSALGFTVDNGGGFKFRFANGSLTPYVSSTRSHLSYTGLVGDSTHNLTIGNGAIVLMSMNPVASTGTLFGGKVNFSPTLTYAGMNFGSTTAHPSGRVNGDGWYRSDLGQVFVRAGGADVQIAPLPALNFWPLNGSASVTGNVTIDFGGHNVSFIGGGQFNTTDGLGSAVDNITLESNAGIDITGAGTLNISTPSFGSNVPLEYTGDLSASYDANSAVQKSYADYGTYTPTISNGTNVASTSIPTPWHWFKNGREVSVEGSIQIATTLAATATTLTSTLPVSSANFTNSGQGGGTIMSQGGTQGFGSVSANSGSTLVNLLYTSGSSTSSQTYHVHFQYRVQ